MKQILFSFYVFALGGLMFACEEQEDFGIAQADKAFNLRVAPDKNSFDISAGDPEVNFTIYSDTKTIDHVEIYVDLIKFGSDGPTPRALLKEIPGNTLGNTSTSVTIKLSEFVDAVGLTLGDLGGGDLFNIYNEVTMSDGRVYPDTLELGGEEFVNMENAFFTAAGTTSFTTTLAFPVLCPFVTADAIGTYSISRDDLEVAYDAAHKPEVIAGPGPNQVTLVDMLGHPQGYDIIVDVNPATDVATVNAQTGWDSANFGLPFGEISVEGGGFYFSCTGFLSLDLAHNLADGRSFGTFRIEFTKE
ncbi:MAG TPA: hypothetical protein VFZ52_24865 [Chryseolinea sp.]